VSDADPEMLRYLSGLGVCVGDELEMLDRQPFEGPCTVRFATHTHVLGLPLCRAMRVSRTEQP
jgi:DtxR family transcriptional regulator, Mn-dependent transcriptional regulator